jgi:hypothetical protein
VDTEVRSYDARINVTERPNNSSLDLGINAASHLKYGEVPRGSNVSKHIDLESDGVSLVAISSSGNISEYLRYDDRQAVNGTEEVYIDVIPMDTGYFEGDVTVKIQSSNNNAGETWLRLKSYFY